MAVCERAHERPPVSWRVVCQLIPAESDCAGSATKLSFMSREVRYLGGLMAGGGRRLLFDHRGSRVLRALLGSVEWHECPRAS